MKLLFWARDIRGGAGERQIFRDITEYLAQHYPYILSKNLSLIPEYGRWDDVIELLGTKLEKPVLDLIKSEIDSKKSSLLYKWCPRPNVTNKERKAQANIIRNFLKLSPKEYRKLLVENSSTVEQLMCAKEWDKIDYSKLPSKAMSDYMKAFSKNDLIRFQEYLESVKKGEAKINAGAIFPYDVTKNLRLGHADGADVQWNALPNYMEGNKERLLPIVDVSGSMSCSAGGNPNVSCLDVAISLGLYISERNVGIYKDAFITFSARPTLQILRGKLSERFRQLSNAHWEMNTDIEAVFKLILGNARQYNVPQEEMPTMLVILSDMQFDVATGSGYRNRSEWNPTAQQMIESEYAKYGYNLPKICYWNLNANKTDSPIHFDKTGTCLVSGFNTTLLKNLLSGKDMTPLSMMMSVVDSERYDAITV
jgi:hypothetical protein